MVHPWPLRAPTPTWSPSISSWREPFLFLFCVRACVYSEHGNAGEHGAIAGVGGRWRVEGGLEGARSLFSSLGVASPSRHEGSMNGLCPASQYRVDHYRYEPVRSGPVRSAEEHSSGASFREQAQVNFRERENCTVWAPTLSSWRSRATVSTGFYARRATGDVSTRGQRGRKALPGPNRWRGGRERGGQRTRLRKALLFDFFLTGARCSNQTGNNYMRGNRDCSKY